MRIPFVDLRAQYDSIKDEIDKAVFDVIESTLFIGGKWVESFEKNFARYADARVGVGTSSGTSALHLALRGLGIGPGDEVITACNTFIATTEAITHSGARPVLVDVEDETLTIDPDAIERALTPRVRAIVPVHLYGQSADMDAIKEIASKHALKVIADAAQAHGAMLSGERKKIQGDATCFSFYPGKNLGAYGDAGMVVTDDEELGERVRMLANHGRQEKYLHEVEGFNYRLDAIQAAVLDVKLKHLDDWNARRRENARRYTSSFDGDHVRPVGEAEGRFHVFHLYVIRCEKRDELIRGLGERGVATGIHYPVPLHLQNAYKYLGLDKGSFPVAERASEEILSLPMYPELTGEMVDEVVAIIESILD